MLIAIFSSCFSRLFRAFVMTQTFSDNIFSLLIPGYYWIDPNAGGISDAIKVFCKMDGDNTETCLETTTENVSKCEKLFR